ncbi:hypothetical protein [Duganella sp. HH105]|uniref:hypothetical protein n=1 Tax=Duganella sp. HH105 TaxID=1781067 RepID=UPI00089315F0|nr:hypothetical protein [Duganella sp. HH105]OEZ55366.1 hypothetical protein DUGA6_54380 [Duganella sp. HH105]
MRGLCLLALLGWHVSALALDSYVIDLNSSKSDFYNSHIRRLLVAALDASSPKYGAYDIKISTLRVQRDRLMLEMMKAQDVNLSAQVTSPEWEQKLIPVRIPVDKGVSGYRISLIDGRDQADFTALRTLAQLKAMSMGAGRQWSSTVVFARNGFTVQTGATTSGLHRMLAAHRFQHFPRAIDEALFEREEYAPAFPQLALERSMAIYVPLPRYFFVGGQPRLAQRLEYGLQLLVADGRFDQIFHEFYDGLIEKAGLRKRRLFRLDNPLLSPQTPLANKAYWYDPFEQK